MNAAGHSMFRRFLAIFPWLTAAVFVLPVLVGLFGTVLPAWGYLPVLGGQGFTVKHWLYLFSHPSVPKAIGLTLVTAWGSSLLAMLLLLGVLSLSWRSRSLALLRRWLSLLLAVPHAAFAIGMLALIAPSGWILKLISPTLTGFDLPPLWTTVNDPMGISLLLVLTLKEIPFLLFMALAALSQLQVEKTLRTGRSLGYHERVIWWRILIPQLLPLLRLPMFAVLAYGLAVVDMAIILGPNAPPPLAVLVHRWFHDADIMLRFPASAGAMFLLVLTILSIMLWWFCERCLLSFLRIGLRSGRRYPLLPGVHRLAVSINALLLVSAVGAFLVLLVWSVAFRWSFPDALPSAYSTRFWIRGWHQLVNPFWLTVVTAITAAILGLILVVGCLEHEVTLKRQRPDFREPKLLWLIYMPLIVPQIAFLFGIQVVLVRAGLEGRWITLLWSHLMFVVPYVFLSLAGPYRGFDDRYMRQAVLLSGSEWHALYKVKWPMLLRPLCYVTALGFAVSLAQYLPTLYVGAGRFSTLTTEAVNMASGGDRRIVAVYALVQWLTPMVIYALALLIPAWRFRHRRQMQLQGQ